MAKTVAPTLEMFQDEIQTQDGKTCEIQEDQKGMQKEQENLFRSVDNLQNEFMSSLDNIRYQIAKIETEANNLATKKADKLELSRELTTKATCE